MKQKVKLICHTWQPCNAEHPLEINGIYTIEKYETIAKQRALIIEGHHYNVTSGWWYDLRNFVNMPNNINKNIRIL